MRLVLSKIVLDAKNAAAKYGICNKKKNLIYFRA